MARRFLQHWLLGAAVLSTACIDPLRCEDNLTCTGTSKAGDGSLDAGVRPSPAITTDSGSAVPSDSSPTRASDAGPSAPPPPSEAVAVEDAGSPVMPSSTASSVAASSTGVIGCLSAPEKCDGTDNDCNGQVDEGFDLTSDPKNCGACGHSCLGGTCEFSTCRLFVLAEYDERQTDVRVFGDAVFSSSASSFNTEINRVSLANGTKQVKVGLALGGVLLRVAKFLRLHLSRVLPAG
jgi:hypothetical protein